MGLSANDASIMAGVANVLDSDVTDSDGNVIIKGLQGSADVFQDGVDNTDKLFVHYFTKDCAVLEDVPGGVTSCSPTEGVEPAIGIRPCAARSSSRCATTWSRGRNAEPTPTDS